MYNRQPFGNNDPTLLQGQMNQQRSFSMNQPLQQQPQPSNASLLAQQLQQSQSQSQVTTPSQQAARLSSSQTSHASNTSSSTPAPTHISMPTTPSLQPAVTNTAAAAATTSTTLVSTGNKALNDEKVYSWINELVYGPNKEQALLELGKKRELYDDLALVLWNSFGVMTSLLEEIVTVYPLLSPPNLNTPSSNRVCNALALLQCVASHPDTRTPFLNAQIPLFLYPFLNTNSKQRPFEYLRLTSLGVIGALVKNDTPEVIQFLLTTEIIPLCLKIMESSSELSKTVAIFIVQKILIDDNGLSYICQTFDRFDAVSNVLKLMIDQLVTNPTGRLLKHVIRCYLRLADNPDASVALKDRLPEALKDNTFSDILRDDAATKSCLTQLLGSIQQ